MTRKLPPRITAKSNGTISFNERVVNVRANFHWLRWAVVDIRPLFQFRNDRPFSTSPIKASSCHSIISWVKSLGGSSSAPIAEDEADNNFDFVSSGTIINDSPHPVDWYAQVEKSRGATCSSFESAEKDLRLSRKRNEAHIYQLRAEGNDRLHLAEEYLAKATRHRRESLKITA